jgi:hypothetical protein
MTKLTGSALDQAVANVLGIKSVHNCEKWVGLTDDERIDILVDAVRTKWDDQEIIKAIEAKLKEKNT